MYDSHPVVNSIKDSISKLNGKTVTLFWCPGHTDINGNEKADKNAKEALNCSEDENDTLIWHDYKSQIKKYIFNAWLLEINQLPDSKIKEITSIPCKKFDNFTLNRRNRQIITRLRIGHTNLTHKHYMNKTEAPICDCGTNSNISIKHFNDCSNYTSLRRKFRINNIKVLSDPKNIKNIIAFLKEINIYKNI